MKDKKTYLVTDLIIWISMLIIYISILMVMMGVFSFQKIISIKLFFLLFITFVTLLILGYFLIYKKSRKLKRTIQTFLGSYSFEDIFQQELLISKSTDRIFTILSKKFNKSMDLNLSKNQSQYLALQNQINPHFLYNTLECIRSEAVIKGVDGVASMTEALATFFRYTISNVDQLVTLEDELANIENYYMIQQYRFGDKLNLSIEYDHEEDLSILELFMPKLILQPIVENSIYHGMERKVGKGYLRIKIERTVERLIIRISDNGLGIEEETLNQLNKKLLKNSPVSAGSSARKEGGIAIVNVNNRIKLLFGEQYGIHIHSAVNVGTDVEITLPTILKR